MEQLIASQSELHGRITRTGDNVKKAGASKLSVELIRTTLSLLEDKWKKFEAQHFELMREHHVQLKTSDYVNQDLVGLAEVAYSQQRTNLLQLEQSLLAEGEKNKQQSRGLDPTPQRTSFPRIELPKFSGKFEDWPAFRDLFTSLITQEASLQKVEKLHFLKASVKGDAESLLRSIPSTNENFDRAWKMLSEHFENKRLIVNSYLDAFISLPKMRPDSADDLRRIFHGVIATAASLEGIGRPISNGEDLFVHFVTRLLDSNSRREWDASLCASTDPPSFEELRKFLQEQLLTQEALQRARGENAKPVAKAVRTVHAAPMMARGDESSRNCPICKAPHYIAVCERYQRMSPQDRRETASKHGRCWNCLGRHLMSDCGSTKTCFKCSGRHHSSLHEAFAGAPRASAGPSTSSSVHVAQRDCVGNSPVLLATARVNIRGCFGEQYSVRALIDSGSETSLVAESLAQRLRVPRTPTSVAIYGVGGAQSGLARGRVTLTIESRTEQYAITISSLVLPRLSAYNGAVPGAERSWPHLNGLGLADPEFLERDPVELLLGADVYGSIALPGMRKGGCNEPIAQRTRLGWILLGAMGVDSSASVVSSMQCSVEADLSEALRRFWEWEEPHQVALPLTPEEKECEEHFCRTHIRLPDGRYQVRLPFRGDPPDLFDTRRAAVRMLAVMERRFGRDETLREQYRNFMREYETLGHMSPVATTRVAPEGRSCYLPHHGVFKSSGDREKIRVVFNGSAHTPAGTSLNKCLLPGPNLLPSLADVVLRWRWHRYVFAADIEKMYRQIQVDPQDRDLQRVLWNGQDGVMEFQLNTVTYGLASAPYLAIRVINQLAADEESRYPLGAVALRRDSYVDDVLTGASTLEAGQRLRDDLRNICTAGGFPLKKWAANNPVLLESIPPEDRMLSSASAMPSEEHSILGLRWNPGTDSFSPSVHRLVPTVPTKRSLLSGIARLFDPMGWLAPVIVRAKLLLQTTWVQQLDWDAPLADEEARAWKRIEEDLPLMEKIQVPRWFSGVDGGATVEIHGFCDASERAYAAVIYIRTESAGEVSVSLALGKTKIAPLKPISLPRLELCSAALLAKLSAHVRSTLGLETATTVHWSDSTVALSWIRGHPTRWTTFVANRVAEIQRTSATVLWRHIPGRDNPADCASRGVAPQELLEHPLWWQGPPFLKEAPSMWPEDSRPQDSAGLPELRPARCHKVKGVTEPAELQRFSCLRRLLRVTAWMLRWREQPSEGASSAPTSTPLLTLEPQEIDNARDVWLRVAQEVAFHDDLDELRLGRALPRRSPLRKLAPFLDDRGVLRVGGRLKHSLLPSHQQHPAILPSDSHLSRLIIEAAHRRTLHGGAQATLAVVRQQFWALRGRQLVKGIVHRCPSCIRWRAANLQPRMGDLPRSRVTPSRPFSHSGVDFAGPILLRTSKGRGQKAYKGFLAVFVCFSTRAVHLEVVSDYTAEAFLAAFRRFVSRRGLPKVVHSDCGTNFVGADTELRNLFRASTQEGRHIFGRLADEGVKWSFNPPAAPHFGGLWEAAVKSVKHHLRRTIGETRLTFEEMATFLAEVEACLNSRPLQPMSDDPDDLSVLTPGHFLVGGPLIAVPEPSLLEVPENRLTRWRLLQSMRDHLWHRWSAEYLQELTPRPKWWTTTGGVKEGQLCLLKNETTAPTHWPLARVTRLHFGSDGEVRVVEVRTARGALTRPVVKIVPLPYSASTT